MRAERSVREKARWLGVGWHELGERESEVARGARGGSGCWGWLGVAGGVAGGGSGWLEREQRAESEKRERRNA